MIDETIKKVRDNGLCTGCGTCVTSCPFFAIEMVINNFEGIYVPKIDATRCNQCGICFEVCPGHSNDFRQLNIEFFGREPKNILIGNYINCYVGHSMSYRVRYNSSSGGLVTQLLLFALEGGMKDRALYNAKLVRDLL